MTARFTDKVVLVTGGGAGIGRATALAFAAEDATVVVAGRTEKSLTETVELIEDAGGRASSVVADVTDDEAVAAMVAAVVERHDRLDIAVNNAGVLGATGPLAEIAPAEWARVVEINLHGTYHALRHEITAMRRTGGGVIVNLASVIGAHASTPRMAAYGASKAAVSALTRTAAKEYIGEGIRINAVSPASSDTSMSLRPGEDEAARAARVKNTLPIGRIGALDEITGAILWLASPAAGFAVGLDLVVDGGLSA